MNINPLSLTFVTESTKSEADKNISAYETQQSFSNLLKGALEKVNDAQVKSDLMTEKLAKGENVDLHNVMIAAQKASVTLDLTLQIRNKAVEAYQEIMRMQI